MKINLPIGTLHINFYKKLPQARTIGIRNTTQDGKRLLFLDYDNYMLKEQLIPELKYYQKKYKLSNFYIFKSSQKEHGYHAICLDKLDSNLFMQILIESGCDERFKTMSLKDYKAWVLRINPKGKIKKPNYLLTIKSPYDQRIKSKAHALFLQYHYNINTKKLINQDNQKIIIITSYDTISNVTEHET